VLKPLCPALCREKKGGYAVAWAFGYRNLAYSLRAVGGGRDLAPLGGYVRHRLVGPGRAAIASGT